jgi:hypothetical protein
VTGRTFSEPDILKQKKAAPVPMTTILLARRSNCSTPRCAATDTIAGARNERDLRRG